MCCKNKEQIFKIKSILLKYWLITNESNISACIRIFDKYVFKQQLDRRPGQGRLYYGLGDCLY